MHKNLSVLIGANRFFYYLTDAQKNILAQRHYLFSADQDISAMVRELSEMLHQERLLQQSFKQIDVAIDNHTFAFIPTPIYQPELQSDYLNGVCSTSQHDMIFADEVEGLGLKNVHSIDARLFDVLEAFFNNYGNTFRLYHSATPFLTLTKRLTARSEVFVNVQPSQINIAVYKSGKFQLYNTFKYNSAEAFLYYVLLMYQQFELSTYITPVTLTGGIMPDSTIYRLLLTYIKQVKFAKRTKYYQFSPKYSVVPQQFYFDLYSLSVCE